ncbi:metal-dependent hydrolase [Glaciecola sp. MF2-115]|uniref:metal-dependent hydrolase n=1 Tax=Glaciecola sp. MF2-115 TaxID=3384827 RepID=UPI0039A0A6EA
MDSLTQVALGGAVAYAVLGQQVGRKAVVWGAVLGTLPDLDVFLPYGGEVEAFTYHRGFSHSLFVHLLASPFITWLILKIHTQTRQYRTRWFCLVFLCLSTHAILDSFTVYGTQLMWPLTEYPVGVSNLFIIDPLYTLPLLVGVGFTLMPKISLARRSQINGFGLVLSSAYIVWSLIAKVLIDHKVDTALLERGINDAKYVSTPAPLNTLLWRIVVMSDNQYYEGYASVFDESTELSLTAYKSYPELLEGISNVWGVERLQWFTKGFYSIRQNENKVILSDLRMGVECSYAFNFVVGEKNDSGVQSGSFEKITMRPDMSKVALIWDRIWDPSVSLASPLAANQCLEN